jgi:hypothetical protein
MKLLLHLLPKLLPILLFNLIASCLYSDSSSNTPDEPPSEDTPDQRAYQHGIDLIRRPGGNYWLIWASSGNPPAGPETKGGWTHDIYYSDIDPANPEINPVTIISADEAQEPASSAINHDGNIMITNEDGYDVENVVGQRYGVYTEDFSKTALSYPQMVLTSDGGHSGHVAASGDFFVVHWSDGWDDTVAGADGIGTGEDVLIDVFDSDGVHKRTVEIATESEQKDWWPLIAGSDTVVCLAWQRYNEDDATSSLMYAVYNPATDRFEKEKTKILDNMKYYTYDVQYHASIDRFLIRGTYADNESGFVYLVDPASGEIVDTVTDLAPIPRESQSAASLNGSTIKVVYPTYPNGAEVLSVTSSTIALKQTVSGTTSWSSVGTDGYLKDDNTAVFFSLAKTGLKTVTFEIN